ncbi:MAG: hypothetical protein AVDCRST_MAG27-1096, partial [uncultured Craurococcus sp.]
CFIRNTWSFSPDRASRMARDSVGRHSTPWDGLRSMARAGIRRFSC